jgi:hypothetical protein
MNRHDDPLMATRVAGRLLLLLILLAAAALSLTPR